MRWMAKGCVCRCWSDGVESTYQERTNESPSARDGNRKFVRRFYPELHLYTSSSYIHIIPNWANDLHCYCYHGFRHAALRRHQPFAAEEILDDVVSLRLVIVEIQTMPRIRLDMGFEILSRDVGEVFLNGSWDGGQFRVAGCEAVAAAVREVVCCAQGFSMEELGE